MSLNPNLLLAIPLLPLLAAIIAGLFGRCIGRAAGRGRDHRWAWRASCLLSLLVFKQLVFDGAPVFNEPVYTWLVSDGIRMQIGFLVDPLTVMMMVVVTFVSLCVHVYTIGYMHDDPGYQRFFSYISLFTFAMLMLVMSNNFLQLFFGWEAVGVVSYLLIGFWYTRPTAIFANMKAFLVNRVGDFGFLLGIAGIVYFTGSLQYADAFAAVDTHRRRAHSRSSTGTPWNALTVICICLFIGAMGKSAQMPLHVWLPDSMEGPTPDLGADPCRHHGHGRHLHGGAHVAAVRGFRRGAVLRAGDRRHHGAVHGLPRHHPERHQARGGLFHALAAGLHDGGAGRLGLFGRRVPPDDACLLQGAAVPGGRLGDHRHAPRPGHPQHGWPAQVHADHLDHLADRLAGADRHAVLLRLLFQGQHHPGGGAQRHRGAPAMRTFAVLAGVFVTAFYSFRMYFLVFHGKERFRHKPFPGEHDHADEHGHAHVHVPHESPAVVWVPLVALAIPSVIIGYLAIGPMLGGDFFDGAIFVDPRSIRPCTMWPSTPRMPGRWACTPS